ncbi:hypothetical protein Bp8pS_136 [Bacillus phage vB_BpuM-BpSp]|nr:hypothetical protein Bp8pS_136 [Bacillus phage vB_BpuM-BpSp]
MGRFDSVTYKSLANEENSFRHPRQKMWGVFLMSDYDEKEVDEPNGLNYNSDTSIEINKALSQMYPDNLLYNMLFDIAIDDGTGVENLDYYGKGGIVLDGFNPEYAPVGNTTPDGDKIKSFSFRGGSSKGLVIVNDRKLPDSTYTKNFKTYKVYKKERVTVVDKANFYYYFKLLKTASWELIEITNDYNKAKEKYREWIVSPDYNSGRPKAGSDSIILTEIVPSDVVTEL